MTVALRVPQVGRRPVPTIAPALEGLRRTAGDQSFRSFVSEVNPRFQWYRHCEVLGDLAERVVAGEMPRLMISLPPRIGKTELFSRLLPAYFLRRHPDRWVGLNCYAAELAYTLSRNARENYTRAGGSLADSARAVKHWETGKGGGLWAAGVGGPITGKGFHLGLIDDPLKNAEEAESATIREAQKDWYRSTFYTRAEPDAAVIVIQTRWHEDDLSGFLLEEEAGEEPERWHVASFDAIREDLDSPLPSSCIREDDWREPGEPLCPERYPLQRLKTIRDRLGPYFWAALYQQRPAPRGGGQFRREWFRIVDVAPAGVRRVRSWDLAATEGGGNWTVGTRLAVTDDGTYFVEDVVRGQWSSGQRDAMIRQTAELDGTAVPVLVTEEGGSGGKAQAAAITRTLAGFPVNTVRETGSKELRADPFRSQCEAGNVRLVRGEWNRTWLDELSTFPRGKYDDQVDSVANGFNWLAAAPEVLIGRAW